MQSKPDILTHPFYPYAEYALETVRTRFPNGAGNVFVAESSKTVEELTDDMSKFAAFSQHSLPNGAEFSHLIADLNSATADIMTCYAIGALRIKYQKAKHSLFNCIYINQTTEKNLYTHVLLLIGADPTATDKTLFSSSPDALICDLWTSSIYTVQELHARQAENQILNIFSLWYNVKTQVPVGICLDLLRPLQGDITKFSQSDVENFFIILQEMVIRDRLRRVSGKIDQIDSSIKAQNTESLLDQISHLNTQSLFAHSFVDLKHLWEEKHPDIVGYVSDELGNVHTIRRMTNTKQYAYWDLDIDAPMLISLHKNSEEQWVSHLGTLESSSLYLGHA